MDQQYTPKQNQEKKYEVVPGVGEVLVERLSDEEVKSYGGEALIGMNRLFRILSAPIPANLDLRPGRIVLCGLDCLKKVELGEKTFLLVDHTEIVLSITPVQSEERIADASS